jgi:hypothetical protein
VEITVAEMRVETYELTLYFETSGMGKVFVPKYGILIPVRNGERVISERVILIKESEIMDLHKIIERSKEMRN